MARQRSEFSLGLWVIVVLVLFVAVVIFIGERGWGQAYRSYTVRFPVTYSLPDEIKAGAQVFCGGAMIGRVHKARLQQVEEDGAAASLYVYLDVGVSDVVELRSDCIIVARGPLLGGGGKLIIADPGRDGRVLEEGTVIDGSPAGSFNQAMDYLNAELDPDNPVGLLAAVKGQLDASDAGSIIAKVHASLDDLNAITQNVSRQVNPAERDVLIDKLHTVLDNVNAATAQLRAQVQSDADGTLLAKMHTVLDSANAGFQEVTGLLAEERQPIHDTLQSVQRTVDLVEHEIAEPIASELDRANAKSLLNQVHASFDKINASLGDLQVVTDHTRTLVTLNEERVNRLMTNLGETAAHLKSASKDLRRNPWRLLYRPSLEETKQLNIFDAAREFSEAAARLDDSATQLAALMKSHDGSIPADDAQLAEIRQRLQQTFEDYGRAEEALWKQLDVR
ncbi:MAG TPA: hypothetical protein VM243_15360 [Phycisphaerae bacterium]|nr:hypothetical protein [Phycisphaerae bacterium]